MRFDWWTFALQTVNFAALVWLLHRFLFKPVKKLTAARRAEIEKQFEQARAAGEQADAALASVKAERAGMAAERDRVIKEAGAQADAGAAAQRQRAAAEAAELLENARKTMATERAAALAEARTVAADLGCDIARRLLGEIPMNLRAEAWLERVEQHLLSLAPQERERLAHDLSAGVPLKIVSASALPEDSVSSWRSRLQRVVGNNIVVEFATDPGLIGGVELHFPSGILRFSWHSALAAIRSELDADGAAR
ncbi:MAG: F0F1 ATP synthase subunit delta [Steroidobacteraceae bacterium]